MATKSTKAAAPAKTSRAAAAAASRRNKAAPQAAGALLEAGSLARQLMSGAGDAAKSDFCALVGSAPEDQAANRIFTLIRDRVAKLKSPSETAVLELLLLGAVKLNRVDAAHTIFDRLIELAPQDANLVFRKGMLHYRSNAVAEAAALWEPLRGRYDRPYDLLKFLAQAYMLARDTEKALQRISEAIALQPKNAEAYVIRGKALAASKDYEAAGKAFRQALLRDSKLRDAYSGLIATYGKADRMIEAEQAAKFFVRRFPVYNASKDQSGLRVLLLEHTSRMLLTDARYGRKAYAVNNMVSMMQDGRIAFSHLYIDLSRDPAAEALKIPPCDVVYNNAANAELLLANKGFMLRRAVAICRNLNVPVLNPPEKVIQTTRRRNYERFKDFPGVVFPKTIKVTFDAGREDEVVRLIREAMPFPLIMRQSYTHADTDTDRIHNEKELRAVLPKYAGKQAYIIQYFDCRDADGIFRRYRAIFVGDRMFPSSVLAAQDWNVHGSSAIDLMDKTDYLKDEEQRYQADMASVVGQETLDIFWKIREVIGLDYFGIDYNFDPQGRLIIFEINPSMNLAIRERGAFPYLLRGNEEIKRAMEDLMIQRARSTEFVPAPLRRHFT